MYIKILNEYKELLSEKDKKELISTCINRFCFVSRTLPYAAFGTIGEQIEEQKKEATECLFNLLFSETVISFSNNFIGFVSITKDNELRIDLMRFSDHSETRFIFEKG